MFCHKCGSLLSDEAKFCPHCGEKIFVLNGTITDFVELNITSIGVNNEIFSNMEFDIFIDDIHIGSVSNKGISGFKTTPGQHCIKIGAANIRINIPKEEKYISLDFIWGPNIGQRIVCQQNQFVINNSESEIDRLQRTPNKKRNMLVLGIASIAAVFTVGAIAASINSGQVNDVSAVSDYMQDMDLKDNGTIMTADTLNDNSTHMGDIEARKAYAEKVQEMTDQDSSVLFNLIDLDGDDVLELVADHHGYDVSVFTWADGKIITLMDKWVYGVMGNHGYEYLPGRNVIYNYNMNHAGAIIIESYWAVNRYYEVASLSGETLRICYFNDINRNGIIDEGEEFSDEPFYYYGDTEITEEEYAFYQFEGDYELISGNKTADEILRQLNEEN